MKWIFVSAVINACATTTDAISIQRAMCEQFAYITYSKLDTAETIEQIGTHNHMMEELCTN